MNLPNLLELRTRHKTLIAQANALLPASGAMTLEADAKFDALMNEADILKADIIRAETRSNPRPPRSLPGATFTSNDASLQKRAFREWLRTGEISAENRSYLQRAETRDLGAGAVAAPITGGNVLVPVGFDPQLNIAQKSFGQLLGAVRNFRTDSGEPMKVALADDTEQMVTVLQEATAASESDPNLSGFTSSVDELTTGLIRVSNQLINDSAFDVDDFIQNTFAARYFKGVASAIATGNGSNIQKLTPAKTVQLAAGNANGVGYAALVSAFGALDPAYQPRASWVMNSATKAALMALSDNYGRPLLQTDITGEPFNAIFGRPIVIAQGLANFGPNNTAIMFGDLAASYTLRTVGGLQIARSTQRFFEFNETAFIGYARVGGYNTSQSASSCLIGIQNSAT